jgi:hypothetical protein
LFGELTVVIPIVVSCLRLASGGLSSGFSHELPGVFSAPVKIAHELDQPLGLALPRRRTGGRTPMLALVDGIGWRTTGVHGLRASAAWDGHDDHLHVAACSMMTVVHQRAALQIA